MPRGPTTMPDKPRWVTWRALRAVLPVAILALASLGAAVSCGRAASTSDRVIAAAGDYGCDPLDPSYNNLDGTPTACRQKATSDLLVGHGYSAVLALGDQHYCGSFAEYEQAYDPTWGRVKSITHPVPGNHEYMTTGTKTPTIGCDRTNANAAGYFTYFGTAAGTPGQGWYSFDLGAWHLIALNSNCQNVGGCSLDSPQAKWLAADLAAHPDRCTLAYWHVPLFGPDGHTAPDLVPLWQELYAAHADLVLNGHHHSYERFDPQEPNGVADPANGIREFIVGTGGASHNSFAGIAANSVVRDDTTFGILALTLHTASYSWTFEPAVGSFTDSGSAACHSARSRANPTPRLSPTGSGVSTYPPVAEGHTAALASTTNHGVANALPLGASPGATPFLRFSAHSSPSGGTNRLVPTIPTRSKPWRCPYS